MNRVTLIGFLGADAEKKSTNGGDLAILSLATKTSWKNDSGSWESRTDWHRCVAFGKLANFAGTLTKGQGSGNFQSTPAVWKIEHGKPVLLSHQ